MNRLGRLPLRALVARGAAAADAEGARVGTLLAQGIPFQSQASDTGDTAPQRRTQLLMLGSYAVSGTEEQAHAQHVRERSSGGTAEAAPSRTQLHMAGESVTSAPPEASSSGHKEEADEEEEDVKRRLLAAALKHVKAEGWTAAAVRRAAAELQLSPAAVAAFTRPEAELVQFFIDGCNRRLRERLEASRRELQALPVSERLRTALRWRLEMLIPNMDTWPQALAVHTSPGSLPAALRQVGELVDDVWHAAGDGAAGYDWYAKRGALAAAYAATEAFMLTDYSPGYADTWEALDRRLAELEQLGRLGGQVQAVAGDVLQRLGASLSWFGRHERF